MIFPIASKTTSKIKIYNAMCNSPTLKMKHDKKKGFILNPKVKTCHVCLTFFIHHLPYTSTSHSVKTAKSLYPSGNGRWVLLL